MALAVGWYVQMKKKKVREPLKQRIFCLKAEYVVSHVGTAKTKADEGIGVNRSGDNAVKTYSCSSFSIGLISICPHAASTSPLCPSEMFFHAAYDVYALNQASAVRRLRF